MAARQLSAPRPALAIVALVAVALLSACSDSSADGDTAAPPSSAPSSAASSTASPGASGPSASTSVGSVTRFAHYVALGDSYTAAPGVPGETSNDGCLRSSGNYPHLLATALPVARLVDVSCGGADTADVRRPQLRGVAPQLDAVTRGTDLVTIGLGGNDAQLFGHLLSACIRQDAATTSGSPCADSLGPSVPTALRRIEANLSDVVRAVRQKAPGAEVVLVGYPQIVPASGRCAEVPFAPDDYAFARQVNRGLTEAVERAATATRTTYVDIWTASKGHDICSADPWINGLSGAGAAPFHPFAAEQAEVARLVAAALR
jgi:lysophospholipase L1-like esterase